ncbi:MAG TPA: hypothetical protein VFZ34_29205 [Blastocatellia bacterium]|nr:hypothetical protein [Blastocatellia bacterium]
MNDQPATSLQHKVHFIFVVGLLLSLLGVLVSGFTQKSPRPLTVREAVVKENANTLRAKEGFEFVQEGKRIKVVERSTRRFVVMGDGICGGGCSACSALIDEKGKTVCKGCNANPDCKLSGAF